MSLGGFEILVLIFDCIIPQYGYDAASVTPRHITQFGLRKVELVPNIKNGMYIPYNT